MKKTAILFSCVLCAMTLQSAIADAAHKRKPKNSNTVTKKSPSTSKASTSSKVKAKTVEEKPESSNTATNKSSPTAPSEVDEESSPAALQIEKVEEKPVEPIASFINSLGMKFVKVPAGSFIMGTVQNCPEPDPFNSRDAYDKCMAKTFPDETPAHRVTFRDDFWIGQYEVMQAQWHAVMGNNPSVFKSDKVGEDSRNFPVDNVSWDDVQDFVSRLNAIENKQYRLPTEAEWEYACRSGGKGQEYCGGDTADAVAWYHENLVKYRRTLPSGTKAPNGLGIYDMSGNVFEWCIDMYYADYYSRSPEENPLATEHINEIDHIGKKAKVKRRESLSHGYRVLRGGSFEDGAEADWYAIEKRIALRNKYFEARSKTVRAAARFAAAPDSKKPSIGFRLVVVNP